MAKQRGTAVLERLKGKRVVFEGKFGRSYQRIEERLKAKAEAQSATVQEEIDAKTDYLVVPEPSAGKGVQKKMQSLNAKGASIQLMDQAGFEALVKPTQEEILGLLRGDKDAGPTILALLGERPYYSYGQQAPAAQMRFATENFDGLDLSDSELTQLDFEQCSFIGAKLAKAQFEAARNCDFARCEGASADFADVEGSRFTEARLAEATFHSFSRADFSGARLEGAQFSEGRQYRHRQATHTGCVFAKASMAKARFHAALQAPDFSGADLSGVVFQCDALERAEFRGANLANASFINCKMIDADLTGANLKGANFAGADLTGARVDGADLADCNLRGANLSGVDLSKAKNYTPVAATTGSVGPALTELDALAAQARRIDINFHVQTGSDEEGRVRVGTSGLRYGWGIHVPSRFGQVTHKPGRSMSDALLEIANLLGGEKIRFETLEVESSKSPKGGKELRDIVIKSLTEAFVQTPPAEAELAAATKAWREQTQQKVTVNREEREKARAEAEKAKAKEKKKIEKTIEKKVGKVTDTATFLKALELRIEKPKIDKATRMLKASGFKLFNDVAETHLNGVVKSQTDPDLVYACRIENDGKYACCTQNLNICGGLRGSICKHLLVLIIGLVQAGELEPTTIDTWVAKSASTKAELDKETMGEIFIRYKGAEAGEVDWRPTETVPEDYYAL